MTEAFRPFRGGYYTHPFGASWFIVEFLRGNSPYGSERIDPSRGAHQAHIHNQYKQALRYALAEDQAARDQEKWIKAGKPLTDAEMQLRSDIYHSRIPARLHRMRYASFTVYFALLKRLGWVEPTGEQRPSEPQDYDPNFQPRIYYRLTPQGLAADVPVVFDPVLTLYPHYTREKRSGKKRPYLKMPRMPVEAPEAPEAPEAAEDRARAQRLARQAEADAAFARQAEALAEEATTEEATTEEAEAAESLTSQAETVIAHLRNIPDEEQKAKSLKRLEKAIGEIPPEVREMIEGLDDLGAPIEAYRDILPEGLTRKEYKGEKEAAWKDIKSSLEELEVVE